MIIMLNDGGGGNSGDGGGVACGDSFVFTLE